MAEINMQITKQLAGEEETARQFMYMDKAKEYVESLAAELGRRPSCCVTTFGCQMLSTT